MTRDAQIVLEARDASHDAEIYGSLWAAAPFPRLPADAPSELRRLTVELDDPKRVYAIHRASRRYNFQILVERYVLQIRYGCQSKTCTTPTCFSCRRRLAGNVPVRRYNATSARTLAVYMASQDNPEQGLCQNPKLDWSTLHSHAPQRSLLVTHTAKKSLVDEIYATGTHAGDLEQVDELGGSHRLPVAGAVESREVPNRNDTKKLENGASVREERLKAVAAIEQLDESTATDHRSFVQNVFGTVAFKMLEWLTPRNLEQIARAVDGDGENVEEEAPILYSNSEPESIGEHKDRALGRRENTQLVSSSNPTPGGAKEVPNGHADTSNPLRRSSISSHQDAVTGESLTNGSAEPRHNSSPKPYFSASSGVRQRADSIERPKSILNIPTSPKMRDSGPDPVSATNFRPNKPKRTLSHQTSITSSQLKETSTSPDLVGLKPTLVKAANSKVVSLEPKDPKFEPILLQSNEKKESPLASSQESSIINEGSEPLLRPQSLSRLSIDTIEFLCDVLQADDTCEKHILQPRSIYESFIRGRVTSTVLKRRQPSASRPSSKDEWRSFVEQSFFHVLSNPESALESFRDSSGKLFDTQTMWYLMLRMTRVAPSLVFDSLWNMAGTLFRPPEKLGAIHERAKEPRVSNNHADRGVSTADAAHIIYICLHALVAAAPLVTDGRLLANMSRIRSYGHAMIGRKPDASEATIICLQYEDIFTDELAIRLARRVFAAIPTRRRFSELLKHQREPRNETCAEPDVLQSVLDVLKSLDMGTPPILNFPDDGRELHETRVPILLLDWARTVMLQEWQGTAEVPGDGPIGGALSMIAAMYKNRKSLLLGEIHFRTEYFADRLDPIAMPIEWTSFELNKKTVHLLDYPYLFKPATLVTYFRAVNFSRMHHAYQGAVITDSLVNNAIATHNLMTNDGRRQRLYQRLRVSLSHFLILEIGRQDVLVDTFNSIWRREERELMRPLKIHLGEDSGEEGSDSGGVQQEFFRLAIAEALDPQYGAFTIDSRTNMTWFQPGSPEPLWKFELIGMIFSLAVYNGLTLPVTFPLALYRKLLGEEVTELHHIADGWPQLADGLTSLLEWEEMDGLVEDVFTRTYEFSVEQFGQPVSREMGAATHWPQFSDLQHSTNPTDAPMVTSENRNSYVSDYIHWLTGISVWPQYQAFETGFYTCLDRRAVSLLDPETLQSVVEGVQEIDIAELRRTVRYVNWDASHRTVRDFWSIVKRYDLDQRRKLLEFVTASDRLPVGGMRNVQFTIQRNGSDDCHLPSSYTCYGIFLLPEYSSREVLRERLATALENSKGFGFA